MIRERPWRTLGLARHTLTARSLASYNVREICRHAQWALPPPLHHVLHWGNGAAGAGPTPAALLPSLEQIGRLPSPPHGEGVRLHRPAHGTCSGSTPWLWRI